jgi:TP901 family phage tail tape measure protein
MAERQVKVAILGDASKFTSALGVADGALGSFGEKLSSFGKVGALAFGALGVGAVVGLEKIGESFDSAFDSIRIKTGQTGDTLAGLQDSFKTVFSQVPASMDTVSTAISGVNQKLGLTGRPLEDLSRQFVDLSRITKTDLGGNLDAVSSLFNNFGVAAQDQGGKLDELFRASQQSGVSVADLAVQMTDTGAVFRQAGFTFDESASLLALLGKNGLAASDVLPSLSKALAGAAKAGKPASQVIGETFDKIKNAPNDTVAAGDALSVFGAKAGPKLAALIREGKLSYEDFAKAIASGDTIEKAASETDDWAEKLDILKNKVLVALEPVASAVFDGFTRATGWLIDTGLPLLGDAFNTVKDALAPIVSAVADWAASSAWPAIVDAAQTVARALVTAFSTVRDVVGRLIDDIIGGFQNPDATINVAGWEGVALHIGEVIRHGVDIAITAFDAIKSWFAANWPTMQAVFEKAWSAVKVGFEWLLDHQAVLVGALTAIAAVLVGPLIAAIAGVAVAWVKFEKFRDIVQGVVDAVQVAVAWFQTNALPGIEQFLNTVVAKAQDFVKAFSERWEDIRTSVENIVRALVVEIGIVLAPLIFIWQHAHDQILAVTRNVWEFIQSYVQAAMAVIQGIIDVVLGLLSGDWSRAWDGIKEILQGVWDGIVALVTLALTNLQALISGVLAVVAALWSAAWEGIKAVLSAAWDAMIAALSTAIQTVLQFFQQLPGNILAALGDLAGLLVQSGIALIGGLASGIAAAWPGVAQWLAGLPGAILGTIGSLESTLLQAGKDLIGGLLAGAVSAFLDVASWIGGLGEKCAAAVGDLSSKLYEKGRQLIGGFVSGILSRAADVANAIASIPGVGAINNVFGGSGGPDVTPVGHAAGALVTRPEFATLGEGGRDEAVINGDQAVRLLWAMANGASGPNAAAPITINVNNPQGSAQEWSKAMMREATWAYRTKVAA